jgi:hypothetical protein
MKNFRSADNQQIEKTWKHLIPGKNQSVHFLIFPGMTAFSAVPVSGNGSFF